MKKLYLIDGAAGAGKSDLIEFIQNRHNLNANALYKYTTRSVRDPEEAKKSDLIFIDDKEFDKYIDEGKKNRENEFYHYKYGESRYGFKRKSLDDSIIKFDSTFLIIRDRALITRIRKDYKHIALTIHVYIYTDRSLVVERLKKEGFSEQVIDFRLKRSESAWNDYIESYDFSTKIIINNSNKTDFHRGINSMIDGISKIEEDINYFYIDPVTRFKLIKPLIGFRENMKAKIDKTSYEKNVFIMMKFRPENYLSYQYIKEELSKKGYNCVRADEAEWNITNNVYNPLAVLYCCKYGIALFDEPEKGADFNPNVAYELGIMHHQGKECLIIKNNKLNSVPFDLIKDLHKPYSKELEFQKILNDWIVSIT